MTVKQAALQLEVSAATIYSLVSAGKLRCIRVGVKRGCIRILPEHIEEFIRGAEPVIEPAPAPAQRVRLRHLRLP